MPYYGNRRRPVTLWSLLPVLVVFCVVGAIIGFPVYKIIYYTSGATKVMTICSKERTATSGGGEYRIYTLDNGTFVLRDMKWPGHWRTNTADYYGRLHPPGVYRVKYVGFRIGLFSEFPNIADFQRMPDNKAQMARCRE